MQFTQCPEPTCEAIAEIVDRWVLGSSDGPVEFVKTLCLHRHWFMLPVSRLKPGEAWPGATPTRNEAVGPGPS